LWKAPTDPAIKGREILKDTRVVGMRSSIDSHVIVITVPMLFVSDLQHLILALHERLTPLVRDRIVFEISLEIGSQVPIDARGRVRQRDRVVVPHTGRELSTQCDVHGAARVATLTTLILCLDGDRWPASAEDNSASTVAGVPRPPLELEPTTAITGQRLVNFWVVRPIQLVTHKNNLYAPHRVLREVRDGIARGVDLEVILHDELSRRESTSILFRAHRIVLVH
tara:strand:+ start:938 stop:1612 length:675 start_codon:yes stop_codon:yes gene_type:complete